MQLISKLKQNLNIVGLLFTVSLLVACSSSNAPVRGEKQYIVQRGDTVFLVAQRLNVSRESLMAYNGLNANSIIKVGQTLSIPNTSSPSAYVNRVNPSSNNSPKKIQAKPSSVEEPSISNADASVKVANVSKIKWVKPTQGSIARTFNPNIPGHKGIQITGNSGQKILAAASGKVEYVGAGSTGAGQLIIIKHANNIYSTYGYLLETKVRDGQTVNVGSEIASMGLSPDKRQVLHFEIRYNNKPVNPALYLNL